MKNKIVIGSDHAGFELKEYIKECLKKEGYILKDLGSYTQEPVDYPDIAKEVGKYVVKNKIDGILICGTGIGMSMSANKVKGVRAALCHDTYSARVSKEHNNANILCLGGRVIGKELAEEVVRTWLNSEFSKEERHIRRINKIKEIR